jgi:anti-sigma regulatory factor (Ser/Thr protein kinase)
LEDACIGIQEQTDVAGVRRVALRLASWLSFDDVSAGNVALVVTEAAKNLLKHAGGGQVILRRLEFSGAAGIEVLALDRGPGIADPGRCFQDGYSTVGTAGTGLGAIARVSHVHEVYSRPEQGTMLMAQVWKNGSRRVGTIPGRFSVGGVSVELHGELECGDGWISQECRRGIRITVADGLGHGTLASEAAQLAIRTALEQPDDAPPALLARIHGALRATRGAAVAVAEIDVQARIVRFAGIGNIGAAILPETDPMRRLVSHAGTAGHETPKIREFTYPWESRSLLLMYSDGLQTQWSFDAYPGLVERHPSVIAGVLYRDYARGRDDVTVVVAREARPKP